MPLMLNNVQLGGNLTRDPELRQAGNKTVANFGIAINRKYRSGDELKEETTFVDIECWERQAELVGQYLTKGRNVLIEGAIKLDTWEDKESGAKRSKLSIRAHRVHFIGSPKEDGERTVTTNRSSYSQPVAPSQPIDDEPPF